MSENKSKPQVASLFDRETMPIEMVARSAKSAVVDEVASFSATEDSTPFEGMSGNAYQPPYAEDVAPKERRKSTNMPTMESLRMEREKASKNILILFVRGSFLRAYNESAWLVSCLFRSDYKILRDKVGASEPYLYLGFQKNHIEEAIAALPVVSRDDMHVAYQVAADSVSALPSYEQWMKTVKIIDRKESELNPDAAGSAGSAIIQISNAQQVASRLARYHIV